MSAPFRLRKDARKWFKDIEKSFASEATQFEIYYFCLAAGLAGKKKSDVLTDDTAELPDNFPGQFRSKGRVIVAWLLARELQSLAIGMHERSALHSTIAGLVDPDSPSRLSDQGIKEINRYSYGGFELLLEWFETSPRSLETFLPFFKHHLGQALKENP